ncbi:hypothetical protein ACFL6U_05835 [Planctomycetota bacterium]
MTKRTIGIDVNVHDVRAVQLNRTGNGIEVEKVFCAPARRSTDSPRDILLSLIMEHGFDPEAKIAVALPPHFVFYRDIRLAPQDLDRLRQGETTVLDNTFPVPSERLLPQICTERVAGPDEHFILLAATDRESLEARLNLFHEAQLFPRYVDAEPMAIYTAVAINFEQATHDDTIIVHLDDRHLVLTIIRAGDIQLVRNTPLQWDELVDRKIMEQRIAQLISREARISWQKAFGNALDPATMIYLACTYQYSDDLRRGIEQQSGCSAVIVDPFAQLPLPMGQACSQEAALALGLALRGLDPEQTTGVNFLGSTNDGPPAALRLRREWGISAILAGALAVLWLLGLFVQAAYLEAGYNKINKQIQAEYAAACPEAPKAVKPVAQLQQKLDILQQDYNQLSLLTGSQSQCLWILHQIGSTKPTAGELAVTDLLISPQSVRIKGACDSFEHMYQWESELKNVDGFFDVRIEEPRQADGLIRFSLLFDLVQES